MSIRWKNTLVVPLTDEAWMQWACRYPAVFLVPMLGMLAYAGYFWRWLSEPEAIKHNSEYLGGLRPVYLLFGKVGISGFFLLLAAGFGYVFWYYAVREPRSKPKL